MKKKLDKSIAIIGGFGFIGSHVRDHLLKQQEYGDIWIIGRNKIAHYHYTTTSYRLTENSTCKREDILNSVKHVIYLAWCSTPYTSLTTNARSENISVFKSYLKLLMLGKLQQFVFISSAGALYKSDNEFIFSEKSDFKKESLYAEEKVEVEQLLRKKLGSLCNLIILRPTNVYGPGQNFKLGMGIIPKLFSNLSEGSQITLYEPVTSQRDYLYISDFVSAINCCIFENCPSGTYNISSGVNTSITELIKGIEKVMQGKISYNEKATIGANRSVISSDKFRACTSWSARVNILEGLLLTVNWYNNEQY